MRHVIKLKKEERMNIWLDLCDFTFKLMESILSKGELEKRLKKMRQAHLEDDYLILSKLSRVK